MYVEHLALGKDNNGIKIVQYGNDIFIEVSEFDSGHRTVDAKQFITKNDAIEIVNSLKELFEIQ